MKLLILMILVVVVQAEDDYEDAVLNYLLYGDSLEVQQSDELEDGDEPTLSGGMWKCGKCTDINDSKLVYSEVNDVDADMEADSSVDIQLGFTVQDMRCVTVNADEAHVVRRVSGSCSGDTVTLNVAPAHHFVVRVYS
ncbi:uncharacterized protein LOC115446392 [Manduca sexta]|uniref:uncharacterized protein LOC115446392 n=1 Tax=Manduca sexta TaxID=7130 RepID=UPI0011839F6D|nr:uncharacterized protein LOC115446392 [Manduca sexta]